MKKLLLMPVILFPVYVFAGGLVTNTSQSAMFTRFQCRDASLDIDAAYYNPAGLVHLSDGFYLSLNNQVAGRLKQVTASYERLNEGQPLKYEGKLTNPLFPGVYAVYKTGRFAFSAGVNPISGDGVTSYDGGLPSGDIFLADRTSVVNSTLSTPDDDIDFGTVKYDRSDRTEKSRLLSIGYQLNIAYNLDNRFSVAAGIRIVDTRNYTRSSIDNIYWVHTSNTGTTELVRPVSYTETVVNVSEANDTTVAGADTRSALTEALDEIKSWESIADISFTGTGITPVISINYAPDLKTNWAFKYEFRTSIDLLTEVRSDNAGISNYLNGSVENVSIPAMLSLGLTKIKGNRFKYFAGLHYYFDKPLQFEGRKLEDIEIIERNSYELAFGGEYIINNRYRASSGISISKPGVNAEYYNEHRYTGNSVTLGAGVGLMLGSYIDLNLGASYTMYSESEIIREYDPADGVNTPVAIKDIYDSRGWVLSAGIDFLFGKKTK
ncbi:MAG: hypothetical protein V2I37_12340 [Marinilabiliaceae bacterium]|jgi:long-chain fatty acid transport protein|nr:hypothetical protein [Marinilabiliaceae bacterium]